MKDSNQPTKMNLITSMRINFDYTIKFDDSPEIHDSGSVCIQEKNPSKEKMKSVIEAFVAEKASTQLAGKAETTAEISITIKDAYNFIVNAEIKFQNK